MRAQGTFLMPLLPFQFTIRKQLHRHLRMLVQQEQRFETNVTGNIMKINRSQSLYPTGHVLSIWSIQTA